MAWASVKPRPETTFKVHAPAVGGLSATVRPWYVQLAVPAVGTGTSPEIGTPVVWRASDTVIRKRTTSPQSSRPLGMVSCQSIIWTLTTGSAHARDATVVKRISASAAHLDALRIQKPPLRYSSSS